MSRVAVVGLEDGWSSNYLAETFEKLTGFRCLIDPARVSCDLSAGRAAFDGLELTELDALVIKKVGPEYSPDLLDRLEMLRFIESRGVRIFSRPERIIRVLNRLSCTVGLTAAGLPMPPTLITEDPDRARAGIEAWGPSVLKPLYSSKARGMIVVEPGPDLGIRLEEFRALGNTVLYIQKMIDLGGKDLGLAFLGGRYLATYARVKQNGSWNTTTRSGGKYEAFEPPPEIIDLAHKAQAVFGLDFTCVDVALTPDGPIIFEVSAFGGFRGLKEACGLNAAEEYARHVLARLAQGGGHD